MSPTKRIFISDLHMGDSRSLQVDKPDYKYPYGWLHDERLEMLADFINHLNSSEDVKELIVLGDLLDQWICPAKLNPVNFESIINPDRTPENSKVIEAFKSIDANPSIDLIYVPGNHDMLVTAEELKSEFPNIKFIGESNIGVYKSGSIAAEHGSQYTLFCASDPGASLAHNLPIGFYISRAAAEKTAMNNSKVDPLDIMKKFIDDLIHDLKKGSPSAMRSLYEAIAGDCGLDKSAEIAMGGLQDIDRISVEAVADRYSTLWKRWQETKPNGVDSLHAFFNEILELKDVAERQYFREDKAKIVVFGHTHKCCLYGYNYVDGHLTYAHSKECDYIYANSGTWINSCKKCTYIEVETVDNIEHVRLCQYKSADKPRHVIEDMHLK